MFDRIVILDENYGSWAERVNGDGHTYKIPDYVFGDDVLLGSGNATAVVWLSPTRSDVICVMYKTDNGEIMCERIYNQLFDGENVRNLTAERLSEIYTGLETGDTDWRDIEDMDSGDEYSDAE